MRDIWRLHTDGNFSAGRRKWCRTERAALRKETLVK
jgi:hypothetical protein